MSTPDPSTYDAAILACKPTRPQDYAPHLAKMWNDAIANGLPIPPDYPGRILKQCESCDIEVQVGPRQQQALAELAATGKAATIQCLLCAVILTAMEHDATNGGTETTIHNLGNPYKENP